MSSTDVLLNIATAVRLFHASDGTGFADLIIDGRRETWPLRSKRFQGWLRQQYYECTWDAPGPAGLNAALNALEAQAQFDGPQRKVSVRLAEQDGLIYLDLADEFWRCIEIGGNGWRIAEDPPVRFRRSAGMQPLPLPLRGGSVEALAPFLNLASDNDFVLVVACLLGAFRAGGPYPVLAIAGELGSAKTVLSKLLRALIDPSVAPVRALPRDETKHPSADARASIMSAWPVCSSGWSNSICRSLPFLETLHLMEGVASHLARYLSIAVRSAAVILWTAFSSVCCFALVLLTSVRVQSDRASRLLKWV